MTRFRPYIDLYAGQVKQIIGGTLTKSEADLKINFITVQPAGYFGQTVQRARAN